MRISWLIRLFCIQIKYDDIWLIWPLNCNLGLMCVRALIQQSSNWAIRRKGAEAVIVPLISLQKNVIQTEPEDSNKESTTALTICDTTWTDSLHIEVPLRVWDQFNMSVKFCYSCTFISSLEEFQRFLWTAASREFTANVFCGKCFTCEQKRFTDFPASTSGSFNPAGCLVN